jgi:hypothetical protein
MSLTPHVLPGNGQGAPWPTCLICSNAKELFAVHRVYKNLCSQCLKFPSSKLQYWTELYFRLSGTIFSYMAKYGATLNLKSLVGRSTYPKSSTSTLHATSTYPLVHRLRSISLPRMAKILAAKPRQPTTSCCGESTTILGKRILTRKQYPYARYALQTISPSHGFHQ